jgi:uncharacterized protein YfdQ (DUF2303 family)
MATDITPTGAATLEALSPFGIDLDIAAKLGAKADGIEIITLEAPSDIVGLPKSIPVALKRGEQPGVNSLTSLFDAWRLHPQRKAGTAEVQTLEAFCDLVNRHKTEHSVIFADTDWRQPSFTAVIDYHEAKNGGRADHGKHRVFYPFPLSEEWKAWNAMNGEKMSQQDFAYFLEDRVPELAATTDEERIWIERDFATQVAVPSQIVELSRGLRVHVASKVKAEHTLSSGEGQIAWEEAHQDDAGKPLKVPGIFIVSIAPFFMGEKMRIPVRLRYRVHAGSVTWFYQIYRPDQFVTEHVRQALFDAKDRTKLDAFEGKPEMAA